MLILYIIVSFHVEKCPYITAIQNSNRFTSSHGVEWQLNMSFKSLCIDMTLKLVWESMVRAWRTGRKRTVTHSMLRYMPSFFLPCSWCCCSHPAESCSSCERSLHNLKANKTWETSHFTVQLLSCFPWPPSRQLHIVDKSGIERN